MSGQLCWLPFAWSDEEKPLYLETSPDQPQRSYTACPDHAVPDYSIAEGPEG